ncbi:hypothetical protein Gogos_010315 [Gossypium gossypioides]|uniref:DUF4283 domain-containing protein n=1 Tax=Gossypium gossypioides TaxID=34282 RepID=A0A7J9BKW1_GOSGO|nr:hypothetical protein [Gossypium gossypioides]
MEDELASLNLSNDEEDLLQNQEEIEEVEDKFKLCLVGRVLTESVVHFPSMRNTLAKLWHPLGGEDPLQVPLIFVEFRVQVHNLSMGLMSERMAYQFRNIIGQFMEYDAGLVTRGIKRYMCIQERNEKRGLYPNSEVEKESQPNKGRFNRYRKTESTSELGEDGQVELGSDMEDRPIEMVESKKRQRKHNVNSGVSIQSDSTSLKVSINILAIAEKQANRKQ